MKQETDSIAHTRFRWVFCQLEVLRRTLPAHIRRTLDDMPKTLDETYERALLELDEDMRQDAQRLFQCLSVSIRPLRVEELADILAIRFDEEVPMFNPDWRLGDAEEAVLSVCSNLISVVDVQGSQVVQFSHFSVKEFLTSDRLAISRENLSGYYIVPHSAHTILAQASLSVLLQLDDGINKDSIQKFPLSGYAAEHWVNHGRFENVSSSIQVAMKQLFNPEKPHFSVWVWIYDIDDPWRGSMPTIHPERPTAVPLYYAVLCGFRGLIEHLIATYPRDIDTRGGYYESPLLAAFIKEDVDTALLLLCQGADVNARDKGGRSPLHRASRGVRTDIVQILLEHNADVNQDSMERITNIGSSYTEGWTPLHMASQEGRIKIAELLIQHGADVCCSRNEGWTPLLLASQYGHVKMAELLIQHGADVCFSMNDGQTSLHLASQKGHVKMAELLIQNDADVCSPTNDGYTSLHLASQEGHVKMAELLIQNGADVCSPTNDGWTPLYWASQEGHVKMVELLIQHGVDLHSPNNDGWTTLHLSSKQGHVEIAELLIQHGADVCSPTNDGWTPLHWACQEGHVKMAELLIQYGADVCSPNMIDNWTLGWTPLHWASEEGNVKIAEQLIQNGADVCSPMGDGWTPLHSASELGHVKMAELLIQYGAHVGSGDSKNQTPLHLAALKGNLDVVKLLFESGADPNICDVNDQTPLELASDTAVASFLSQSMTPPLTLPVGVSSLTSSINPPDQCQNIVQLSDQDLYGDDVESSYHNQISVYTASKNGQIDIVRMLLDNGSDVNERDNYRQTALAVASRNGELKVAEFLIERGANVNFRNVDGQTSLHSAIQAGNFDIVQLLLDHNADLNAITRNGNTPLDLATFYGHFTIVELLLQCGANPNIQNGYGQTPRQEALAFNHAQIAELLLKYSGQETQ